MAKNFQGINLFILLAIFALASFLRLWNLGINPVSLSSDEVEVGYQSYSILKTGRDYYGNFMPLQFHSIAEWSTPLYIYSSVPTVALWGISSLGVRLPAAIFGILSIFAMYLLVKQISKDEKLAQFSSFVLTISPWHIQYSRVGFPATELLFFLILGLYFFYRALSDKGKLLWVSAAFLTLTPLIYSTAKLFTPILIVFLVFVWRREISSLNKKYLLYVAAPLFIIGSLVVYTTLFGGGVQRFNYLSVFADPTASTEIRVEREVDAKMRGETGLGLKPTVFDRLVHNKLVFWGGNITKNYFKAFSSEFLFIKGDLNMRQSVGMGEFYRIDALMLLLGTFFFFTSRFDKRFKFLIAFWILVGIIFPLR